MKKWKELNPLTLAYLGDAVYELWIRSYLVQTQELSVRELHKKATELVKALFQARFVQRLLPELTEEEQAVVRKGRNAKGNHPRHVDVATYRYATGFEALIGYWYVEGRMDRFEWAMEKIWAEAEKGDDNGGERPATRDDCFGEARQENWTAE